MKKLYEKLLALLLAALLLAGMAPVALMEELPAPVEAVDDAVAEAEVADLGAEAEIADLGAEAEVVDFGEEPEVAELGAADEPTLEGGMVAGESYMSAMPVYEAAGGVPIDAAHFPDAVVRDTLLNGSYTTDGGDTYSKYDPNHDGVLDAGEIAALKGFHPLDPVSSLQGLELLTALEEISIEYTGTTIDLSACVQLKALGVDYGKSLTTVIFPAGMEVIHIQGTSSLSALDISRCAGLRDVGIETGNVTSLDFSNNPDLVSLSIFGNALKTVKLGNHPKLAYLSYSSKKSTTLNISGCSQLVPIINNKNKEKLKHMDDFATGTAIHWQKKKGRANIWISSNTKLVTENKSETVVPAADNSITASAVTTRAAVSVGQTYSLKVSGLKASGFKSSNAKLVKVTKAGKIVPVNAGKAKITYKVGGKTRTLVLTISDSTMPTGITLNQSGTVAAKVGEKVTLTATLNPGAKSDVAWTTSNKKIATVKNGVVTFKKAGKVTITAATKRGNKKAKVKFDVSK